MPDPAGPSMATTWSEEWQQTGARTASRQQEICATLEQTARDISAHTQAQASDTIAEIGRLVQAASEAPKAAAEVVAEPSSVTFGLARATSVKVSRVLTLANGGNSTVHVSIALSRDRVDDGDASVVLTDVPSSISIT